MARIRTIKPEFFTSEDIVGMTPLARLFYVSLWCESDRREGVEYRVYAALGCQFCAATGAETEPTTEKDTK